MPFFRRSVKSKHAALFLILAAALLLAQWTGLSHRIVHADGSQAHLHPVQDAASAAHADGIDDPEHSCAAFDAASLADSIGTPPFLAPLLSRRHIRAPWAAFASWDVPLLCHFSSRAPPRA